MQVGATPLESQHQKSLSLPTLHSLSHSAALAIARFDPLDQSQFFLWMSANMFAASSGLTGFSLFDLVNA